MKPCLPALGYEIQHCSHTNTLDTIGVNHSSDYSEGSTVNGSSAGGNLTSKSIRMIWIVSKWTVTVPSVRILLHLPRAFPSRLSSLSFYPEQWIISHAISHIKSHPSGIIQPEAAIVSPVQHIHPKGTTQHAIATYNEGDKETLQRKDRPDDGGIVTRDMPCEVKPFCSSGRSICRTVCSLFFPLSVTDGDAMTMQDHSR